MVLLLVGGMRRRVRLKVPSRFLVVTELAVARGLLVTRVVGGIAGRRRGGGVVVS
jgi:hypothetical protein